MSRPPVVPRPADWLARRIAKRHVVALVLTLLGTAFTSRLASAQLREADFSGSTTTLKGPTFGPCCNTPFAGLTYRGPNVSGHFIFDAALIPSGTGFVNVPLPTGVEEDPFHLVLGEGPDALIFTAANALPTTVAQVQYRNGAFNGFAYFSAFFYGGHEYQLDVQGGVWTIYDRANGVRNLSNVAASGNFNTGDANLRNVHDYVGTTAAVPEPASLTLVATGLAAVAGMIRRRRA